MSLSSPIQRETFQGVGTLTPGSPGGLGTVTGSFYKLAGGPKITGDATASGFGWSADTRQVATAQGRSVITVTSTGAASAGVFSSFYNLGSLNLSGANKGFLTGIRANNGNQICYCKFDPAVGNFITNVGGIYVDTDTGIAIPLRQWFELRVTWSLISSTNYNVRLNFRLAGSATWTTLYSGIGNGSGAIQSVYAANGDMTGSGAFFVGRYGMAALYASASGTYVADSTATLSDVVDPPTAPMVWYFNPATGAATTVNDGTSPTTAFASVTDFNNMSQYAGFFAKTAPAPITINSLTINGGFGTVAATAHGLSVGQTFTIAGASPIWLNNGGTIISVTANTFAFTPTFVPTPYSGAFGTSLTATGTIKVAPFASGDIVNFDTSTTPLDSGSSQMIYGSRGTKLQPIAGQSTWTMKAWKDVSGSTAGGSTTWTQYNAGTYPNIWQTTDASATDLTGVVVWENDKWLNHPTGASIAAVAATMNTNAGSAGQFYSDGTTLYLVAADNSNPNTNGRVYTRSRYRTGGGSAIDIVGLDVQIFGMQVTKTCLANPTSNDPYSAYGIQFDGGSGGTARLSNCKVTYGSKHCIGLTNNSSASDFFLVDGCDAEQGSPYSGPGGQTPYVSYSGTATGTVGTGATHNYVGCTSTQITGLIGSSAGANPTNQNAFLSHNAAGSNQFLAINWINANLGGSLGCSNAVQSLNVVNSITGGVATGATVSCTVDRSSTNLFPFYGATGAPITVTNSLLAPVYATSSATNQISGTAIYQGCTFDLRGSALTYAGSTSGLLARSAALNFTMQDCVVITNGTTTGNSLLYGATNTDTIVMDHNAYQGVAGAPIFSSYNDGSTTVNRTLAQLQTLNIEKSSSAIATSLGLNSSYVPQKGSAVINFGASLTGIAGNPDYVGTPRPSRAALDAGAIQHQYAIPLVVGGDGDVSELPSTLELLVQNDVEVSDPTKGVVIRSPNGARWRIAVSNMGSLSATSL